MPHHCTSEASKIARIALLHVAVQIHSHGKTNFVKYYTLRHLEKIDTSGISKHIRERSPVNEAFIAKKFTAAQEFL